MPSPSDTVRKPKVQVKPGAKLASAESIAQALTTAIVEHRLAPGTQLKERQLGEIFGVSRTLIREALIQLERVKLVTMRQSAGAFVSTPTIEEAHQVFAVRRMLELEWLRDWVPRSTATEVKRLRTHMLEERDALKRSDVARRTRLLGDFHVEIAKISGNTVLVDLTRELVARSSLILLVYQSWTSASHSSEEHKHLVDAIAAKNLARTLEVADEHLRHVEHNVVLTPRRPLADLHQALLNAPSHQPRRS